VTARCSSSQPSSPFQFVNPGKDPLRSEREDDIQAIFASLDLLHNAIIGSLPHPLRAPGRHSVWPSVVRAEFAMQASQLMMSSIHRPVTLDRISEAVAEAACEELTGTIELCNPSPAIHAIGMNVADEPGAFSAEAAGSPADRYSLVNGLPILAV
jgi:hypothetical protein